MQKEFFKPFLLLLFSFLFTYSYCQKIPTAWEKILLLDGLKGNQSLGELISLSNGDLLGVGTLEEGTQKDGFIFEVDIKKRSDKLVHLYKNENGCRTSFQKVTQSHFGDYFILGSIHCNKTKNRSAIFRYTISTGKMELVYKVKENQVLEDIIWLDNNSGLAAGYFSNESDKLLLVRISSNGEIIPKPINPGIDPIQRIVNLERKSSNEAWLVANMKKIDGNKKDVYVTSIQVEKWGLELQSVDRLKLKKNQEALSTSVSPDGVLSIGGYTSFTDGSKLAGLWEYNPSKREFKLEEIERSDYVEMPILFNYNYNRLLLGSYTRSVSVPNMGVYQQKEWKQPKQLKFSVKGNFETLQGLGLGSPNFYLAGVGEDKRIFIYAYDKDNLNSNTGFKNMVDNKISNLKLIAASQHDNGNENGLLEPGEQGYLKLEFQNSSSSEMFLGRILNIDIDDSIEGVYIPRKDLYIGDIGPGKYTRKRIPVQLAPLLGTGIMNLALNDPNNQHKGNLNFQIKVSSSSNEILGDRRVDIVFDTEDAALIDKGKTGESILRFKATIRGLRGYQKFYKPQIIINNSATGNKKNFENLVQNLEKTGDGFPFVSQIKLKKGKNNISIIVNGKVERSFEMVYNPLLIKGLNLYVLCIGPKYPNLQFTRMDALDVGRELARQDTLNFFQEVTIDTSLMSKEAITSANIKDAFDDLKSHARIKEFGVRDYIVIFYSGHGLAGEGSQGKKFYLLPENPENNRVNSIRLDFSALINDYLDDIPCKKIIFLDACYSGLAQKGIKGNNTRKIPIDAIEDSKKLKEGTFIFASSAASESSIEEVELENGLFTQALLEILRGDFESYVPIRYRENEERVLTVEDLKALLDLKVKKYLIENGTNHSQNPVLRIFPKNLEKINNLSLFGY